MKLFRKKTTPYDEAITALLAEIAEYGPSAPEYPAYIEHLKVLSNLRDNHRRTGSPDPNTILAVAGNLAGILTIIAYEQKHVMNSKGMGLIRPNAT